MDAITSDGLEFPVSVWMKKVSSDEEPRVIVVIEPVERCTAHFTVDDKVNIITPTCMQNTLCVCLMLLSALTTATTMFL